MEELVLQSEPIRANVFIHKTLNGSFQVRNRQLHNLLKQKWNNSEELQKEYDSDYQHFKDKIWQSISENTGSVKHLDFLTDLEKDVFKTADEIDQNWVIEHAAKRQDLFVKHNQLTYSLLHQEYKQNKKSMITF